MKPIFEPSDFEEVYRNMNRDETLKLRPSWKIDCSLEALSCIANAKIQKLIESWPVVYGNASAGGRIWKTDRSKYCSHNGITIFPEPTKGRLAFVEEIVKGPCVHEPPEEFCGYRRSRCKYCGIEIVNEWKAK